MSTAHPRVCGENQDVGVLDLTGVGSPPRVRGKRCAGRRFSIESRLTPACAGKTRISTLIGEPPWAHPRVCGENLVCRVRDL